MRSAYRNHIVALRFSPLRDRDRQGLSSDNIYLEISVLSVRT